jgi:SAM-dependent methyltransferase
VTSTERRTAYAAVEWLSEADRLRYADYWNDEREEQDKPFWILDGNFAAMETYLAETGLPAQLNESVRVARDRFGRGVDGVGVDLAAGTLWAVPLLCRLGAVEHIYCVEYSRHRLLKLGPAVLAHYGVAPERVTLALGDIHQLQLADHSIDFVLLSAAFHHSDRPDALLGEIRRVLKPDGIVLLVGEHVTDAGVKDRFKHMAKFIASRVLFPSLQRKLFGRTLDVRRFVPLEADLLEGDDRLGDHAYTLTQYRQLFQGGGFVHETVRRPDWDYQAFVLTPTSGVAS